MGRDLEFTEPVPRWLRIRTGKDQDDPPFELDDDGFLPEPTSGEEIPGWSAMTRPNDAVGDKGALVLLGEPGAGKTTTFSLLTAVDHGADEPEPGAPGTVWVTGSELSDTGAFNDVLGDHLTALPPKGATNLPAGTLTVVLDQLDEAPNVHRLPARLKRALRGRDTRALRLLIACRTADYPDSLTQILEEALGKCVIADLAPLTRDDALTLAAGTGVDAEVFVDTVVKGGVGMLANAPLTLKILLAVYQQEARLLSRTPRELFEMGVTRLADEPGQRRAINTFTTTVEQRLIIASRIATRMLLSGQRTIWCGEQALTAPADITEGMLAGGHEDLAGAFEVSPAAVSETLKTALFSRSSKNRIAFAHSSFAAFLSARYIDYRLSGDHHAQQGISGVFLAAAPDEATASIPIHLRETAAWMLAHSPEEYRWLATADPEGLIAHAAYVIDPNTRAIMVEGLLRRAGEVEIGERGWRKTLWRVSHPGLAKQLRLVITHVLTTGSDDWRYFAAARLAIRFAQDNKVAEITDSLIQVATTPSLAPALRYSAIKASMTTDPTLAAPRLRDLLESLAGQAAPGDEGEELVGTILSVLWPTHVEFADVLPHLHPVVDKSILGMYRWQLKKLFSSISEADLSHLVDFSGRLVNQILTIDEADTAENPSYEHLDLRRNPTVDEMIAPIFDRITISPNVGAHINSLTSQIARLLTASATLPLPLGIDLVDENGNSTESSTKLRRNLAEALTVEFDTKVEVFDGYHAHMVTSQWSATRTGIDAPDSLHRGKRTHLLDNADFSWLITRIDGLRDSGANKDADALGVIAAHVADLYNSATFELAYTRRTKSEGQYFRWMFDGVELNSRLANSMRISLPQEEWEHADAFAKQQSERLQAALSGNTEAFWLLTRDLRADPRTGTSGGHEVYDPRSLPGASLWPPEEFVNSFTIAALNYLRTEHDYRSEWLGTQSGDYRAEAGYAALIVAREATSLDDLSDRWSAWVGAVLDKAHRADSAGESSLICELIARIGAHAPTELITAIYQLVSVALARGAAPWGLSAITSSLPPSLQPALVDLARDVRAALVRSDTSFALPDTPEARRAAVDVWAALLHEPLLANSNTAVQLAEEALAADVAGGNEERLAIAAGQLLLQSNPTRFWPQLRDAIMESAAFSKDVALACASSYRTGGIADALDDIELVEIWQWLAGVFPPETDVFQSGFIPPERSVHDWRNTVLETLSRRGTPQAVLGIHGLADQFPNDLRIQGALVSARRRAQARATVLLKPRQVIELLADPNRRVVQTAFQLAELLIEVLTDIDRDLPSHSNLLWDCEREKIPPETPKGTRRQLVWRPKPEGSLAAYLAHELAIRLARRAVVVNREVVIRPTDAGDSGERPDILVEAIAFDAELPTATIATVPVEIKGSWHNEVLTAQRTQLTDRYLDASNTDAGVFVVGWYPIDQWNAKDSSRKSKAARITDLNELVEILRGQAAEIAREKGKRTLPYVLDIGRATPVIETT